MYPNLKLAVVDLETTGNQIKQDDIIQIGITFIRNNAIEDTYHSMIKTDLEIPTFIQALTSIETSMLTEAPYFKDIAQSLYQKLKDCVFVAHNVNFDLSFLQQAFKQCGIEFKPKRILDTLEIFKIAFPTEKSYQLSEIATSLSIPLAQAHRADEDAYTTALILIKAFETLQQLPYETKKQLYYLSKTLKYQLDDYFFELVRNHEPNDNHQYLKHSNQIYYKAQNDLPNETIQFEGSIKELYSTIIERIQYQHRDTQLYLAETIFSQLMNNQKSLIEAETGSGKSLAYIVAALMYHIETGEHVMISTNTKILQYQLLNHDIPLINKAMNFSINSALIKSKRDYISLGLVSDILQDEIQNYDVNILKMQLLVWLLQTDTGDIQELNLRGAQQIYLDQKRQTYVPSRHDKHYYDYIKSNANKIQIGVTNHAHLLYASSDNSIYQLFNHCIIDEAHRLPDYALDCSVSELSYDDVKYHLGLIGKTEEERLLKQLDQLEQQRILHNLDIPPIDIFTIKQDILDIHQYTKDFFDLLYDLIKAGDVYDDETSKNYYVYHIDENMILPSLHRYIHQLNQMISHFQNMQHKVVKTVRKHLLHILHQLQRVETALKHHQTFYLVLKNLEHKSTLKLHIKETTVKSILTEQLLNQFESMTMISGTLTFNQKFSTFLNWFENKHELNTYQVNSPTTDSNQGHLFIPEDIEKYNHQNYDQYVEKIVEYIGRYVSTVEGKCLVLFTSYTMLYTVLEYLNQMVELEDYVILSQQPNQNYKIIQQFNHFDKAILLGTISFFEGFDYQSHGIKCVMITKLPFMSQHANKVMLLKDEFDNIFKDYVLPDAVTRFRQGLGRLIRNEDDKGVVVSFDNRLIHSHYKRAFLDTLNHFDMTQGNIDHFEKLLNQLNDSD